MPSATVWAEPLTSVRGTRVSTPLVTPAVALLTRYSLMLTPPVTSALLQMVRGILYCIADGHTVLYCMAIHCNILCVYIAADGCSTIHFRGR